MEIFGIGIDDLSRGDTLGRVREFLAEPRFHRIATVNPEFLLLAEKNKVFRAALLEADLRIADGFGIVLAGLLRGKYIRRFPGADLMEEILRIADRKKLSVYLAVRADGLSSFDEVKSAILKRYPSIRIFGDAFEVSRIENPCPSDRRKESRIKISIPDSQFLILLSNFGAPEQEIFLDSLKNQNDIRLAMGVGGSFDYLVGSQKRAPRWLRTIGLEWFWRVILQPKRWRRIWNAVIVFPFRAIFATIRK